MRFIQKSFSTSQELSLENQGLYVCRRNAQGHKTLEFLFPYEEMLPLRQHRYRTLPLQGFGVLLFGVMVMGRWLLLDFAPSHQLSDIDTGLLALGLLLALSLFLHYGINNLWYHVTLSAPHLNLTLADRRSQQTELNNFSTALERRAKDYLRSEYGRINPLGIIEPQLRRVAWLRELEVLSAREATAMSTRLTGRLTATPLRSMGQELEAPYVN